MCDQFELFEDAEEVWFWFCACIAARADGLRSRSDYCGVPRPCEVGDIYRIIKRLKLSGRLTNRQLRVMYRYGMLHVPPSADRRAKRSEIRLWEEGVLQLEDVLNAKNLIITRRFSDVY